MNKNTILLLEDDNGLRIGLAFDLEAEGYEVIAVSTCRDALEAVEIRNIDLAILDVNLPDGDGFQLCREIKQLQDIPVIFLTARDLIVDQVNGFESGADDYVTKPFNNVLLRKRVQAILKRVGSGKKGKVYDDGYLYIDFENFISKKNNDILSLTPTEFKLLQVLMSNSGAVVTR